MVVGLSGCGCRHEWQEATCTTPETCLLCGKTRGEPYGHIQGDWVEIQSPSYEVSGIRVINCPICGEETDREYFEGTPEQQEGYYKDACVQRSYEELARYPGNYEGELIYFYGKVIQVLEDGNDVVLRVNVTYNESWWEDTVYVWYTRQDAGEARILEDDIVSLWGKYEGLHSYESVQGNTVTLPSMTARFIAISY